MFYEPSLWPSVTQASSYLCDFAAHENTCTHLACDGYLPSGIYYFGIPLFPFLSGKPSRPRVFWLNNVILGLRRGFGGQEMRWGCLN